MKRLGKLVAAIGLVGSAASAQAPAPHERIEGPALPDFVVGYQAANAQQAIREEVPRGETVQRWSRMITTQWLAGSAASVSPIDFARYMAQSLARACPEGRATAPRNLTVSGRPAVEFRADCPLLRSTGKPESFVLLAVSGERDLLVRQVAFRNVPTADDLQWADAVLGGSVVCAAQDTGAPCDRSD